jgi:hypothetical protein
VSIQSWTSTLDRALAILSLMRPLMGTASNGFARALCTVGQATPVVVPKNSILFPIRSGVGGVQGIDITCPFRTTAAATVAIGATPTDIPVRSMLGGAQQNIPDTAAFAWFPAPIGLAPMAAALTVAGGVTETDKRALKCAAFYEMPNEDELPDEITRAMLGQAPGVMLSWAGSMGSKKISGSSCWQQTELWEMLVYVSRDEGRMWRSYTGLSLLDLVESLIGDRASAPFNEMKFTSLGATITGRKPLRLAGQFYAYKLAFTTVSDWEGVYTQPGQSEATISTWAWTKLNFITPEDERGTHPTNIAIVKDASYPQP